MITLTPEIIAGAYSFLLVLPPFRRWRLPPTEAVKFKACRTKWYGFYDFKDNGHIIGVSDAMVGQVTNLLHVTAHEMIHLFQRLDRRETPGAVHNADFLRLSKVVCDRHGWDVKMFV